jgi:hypothetical protein
MTISPFFIINSKLLYVYCSQNDQIETLHKISLSRSASSQFCIPATYASIPGKEEEE